MRLGLALAAALLSPAPALAQTDEPPTASERRLSPEQIEAVLAEAANKREAANSRYGAAADRPRPAPQGEFAISLGTDGYREVVGTGVYPLGNDGAAAISLDYIDLGKRRFPR